MDIYLMQHGEAVAADVDPHRPLAQAGRRNARTVAQRAADSGLVLDSIVHSGKLRAAQTAAILAEALGCRQVVERPGLAPGDPVEPVAAWLLRATGPVAVVGHLPFLDRLASELVVGDPHARIVAFRNAGLVRLVPGPDGRCSVSWVFHPEVC